MYFCPGFTRNDMKLFRHYLFILLLLPVCVLLFNGNTNWHYHYDLRGNLVRHAHPYASSGSENDGTPAEKGHQHSGAELYMLAMLSDTSMLQEASIFSPGLLPDGPDFKRFRGDRLWSASPSFRLSPLRAPPAGLIS